MAYLCTGDISTGQLLEVIHAHCRKEDRFLMAFSPDKAKLEKITYRTSSDWWRYELSPVILDYQVFLPVNTQLSDLIGFYKYPKYHRTQ